MLNQIMSLLPFTIVNITELEMGDHIFRFGAFHRQSFLTHHGIYMGDGYVIHFSGGAVNDTNTSNSLYDIGQDIIDAKVIISTYDEFMANKTTCFRVDTHESEQTEKNRRLIYARAVSQFDTDFGGYNPTKNNCEHFANWCRTRSKVSYQSNLITEQLNKIIKISNETKNYFMNIKEILMPYSDNPLVKITTSALDIIN